MQRCEAGNQIRSLVRRRIQSTGRIHRLTVEAVVVLQVLVRLLLDHHYHWPIFEIVVAFHTIQNLVALPRNERCVTGVVVVCHRLLTTLSRCLDTPRGKFPPGVREIAPIERLCEEDVCAVDNPADTILTRRFGGACASGGRLLYVLDVLVEGGSA